MKKATSILLFVLLSLTTLSCLTACQNKKQLTAEDVKTIFSLPKDYSAKFTLTNYSKSDEALVKYTTDLFEAHKQNLHELRYDSSYKALYPDGKTESGTQLNDKICVQNPDSVIADFYNYNVSEKKYTKFRDFFEEEYVYQIPTLFDQDFAKYASDIEFDKIHRRYYFNDAARAAYVKDTGMDGRLLEMTFSVDHKNRLKTFTSVVDMGTEGKEEDLTSYSIKFSYGKVKITLPANDDIAPCEHMYRTDYQTQAHKLPDGTIEYYHYTSCWHCTDVSFYEKCIHDDEGCCKICHDCPTVEVVIIGPDAFANNTLTAEVNAFTGKIVDVDLGYAPNNIYYDYNADNAYVDHFIPDDGYSINYLNVVPYKDSALVLVNTTSSEGKPDIFFIFDDITITVNSITGHYKLSSANDPMVYRVGDVLKK